MKKIKISVLFLFLIIFSLPVLADDALLSELIRLDEERRAEIKTLHIEYNILEYVREKCSFEAYGQVWEQLGKDDFRFRIRFREGRSGDDLVIMVKDVSVNSSVKYVLEVPNEAFPVEEPLELCKFMEYRMQGYDGMIVKNPSDVWRAMPCPLYTIPVSGIGPPFSYRQVFEKYPPTRVEKIQNDAGDEVVQLELSGAEEGLFIDRLVTVRWTLTIDFDLSKGGLVSKYIRVDVPDDSAVPTVSYEGLVTKFGQTQSGHWYYQEFQDDIYNGHNDPAKKLRTTITITDYTLNEKSENQLGPVRFPEGLIVYEDDSKTGKEAVHIWGKNKSEKKFADEIELSEYLAKHCSLGPYAFQKPPKSVSSIRIALLLLGALLIAAGLYMRRRRGEV